MTGFPPFSAHDASPCRSPIGGAGRLSPAIVPLRHAFPLKVFALAAVAVAMAGPAAAQEAPKADPARRDIVVTGTRPQSGCTAVAPNASQSSAGQPDLACLNGELQAAARAGQPLPSAVDATTAQATVPSKVGTFSYSATQQRMGQNFGKSATPYRPPTPTYTTPTVPGPRPQ